MEFKSQYTSLAEHFEVQKRGTTNGKASFRLGNSSLQTQTLLSGAHGDCSNIQASTKSNEQPRSGWMDGVIGN